MDKQRLLELAGIGRAARAQEELFEAKAPGIFIELHDATESFGVVGPFKSLEQAKEFMDKNDPGVDWEKTDIMSPEEYLDTLTD